jgi:DNA-binding response OmpR family regulator
VNNGEIGIASSLNFGILYLFAAPYLIVMVIGILWYKNSKKQSKKIDIRAILRRTKNDTKSIAEILSFIDDSEELLIDILKHEVKFRGESVDVTATEFKLLKILAQNPGRVYSRSQLTQLVQGYNYDGYDRTIDAHVKNLRRKLDLNSSQFIQTVYGVGYKFEVQKDED